MPMKSKMTLMVGLSLMIAVVAGAWMWSKVPDYRVLYANLADRDGGAVLAALNQMNVPYKMADGGAAILVPSDKVYEARLKLASQGLPKGGTVGFELMENQRYGVTQFQEQVNYQRGLEGELAKSIQSLSAVQSARVHLAIPKPSVFLREQQKPSASVLLNIYAGKSLDRTQVSGILNLVAASVPELHISHISVVDQTGKLLSNLGADSNGLDPNQLQYVQQMEQNLSRRIVELLEPIVGRANVHAQVAADVDFTRSESVAENFKPNQPPNEAAIRSSQISEAGAGATQTAQGIPGAVSNQPPGAAVAPITGSPATATATTASNTPNTNVRKDATVNYEIDKTIRHVANQVGNLKRLSAAVVVNHRRKTNEDGEVSLSPLSQDEMTQINALVREAIGFNKERGDSVNVVNTPFNEPEKENLPEVPFYEKPGNISLAKEIGKNLLIGLLVAYVLLGIIRPLFRQLATIQPAPPAPDLQALPSVNAQQTEGNLQAARQLAKQDPKIVANVVKSWVNKE